VDFSKDASLILGSGKSSIYIAADLFPGFKGINGNESEISQKM
jgi:hypothetical protein